MPIFTRQDALDYHAKIRPGKLEVMPIKPFRNQKDLTLAYSPGVAEACNAIRDNPEDAYAYTGKGNLVGVVSNGTAVLGLGNIGPLAGKPVMEGKGLLFKIFADVDAYDINIAERDPDKLCDIVAALEPTFGGINLEDIKAPECFHIESTLKKRMKIPVFHDDQHGTAIISLAAMLNALSITGKAIANLRIVISGAGAAAVACARLYRSVGVDPENIAMFDSRGHINNLRTGLNREKQEFAGQARYSSLAEAMRGADCFLGVSAAGVVSKDMVRSMSKDCPVIFACANPDPEITYPDAKEARPDAIVATGRSDFPNQVNNVLGFPSIFRGALDVRATGITEGMKIAAAGAIAQLAKEPAPDYVLEAYAVKELKFGLDYMLPKALDMRLVEWVASAVVRAAMSEGVAANPINDIEAYKKQLRERLRASHVRMEGLLKAYGL
ncbi:MAG: malate dehydrogenase [Deltaproteobacteria bacterium]|jgi:malate dehydrogenase (oxaloacetate-decarboxylating)(NADP+)|nr:malate dehydrogenase [Deltaproteobacteria bacterium]